MWNAREAFIKNNDTQYIVLGTVDKQRWLMGGDKVSIYNIEVTGWNTRVYVKVVKVQLNPFIPPAHRDRYAKDGDLGYFDLKNSVHGQTELAEMNQIFTSSNT